jgi:hypothetical protein
MINVLVWVVRIGGWYCAGALVFLALEVAMLLLGQYGIGPMIIETNEEEWSLGQLLWSCVCMALVWPVTLWRTAAALFE